MTSRILRQSLSVIAVAGLLTACSGQGSYQTLSSDPNSKPGGEGNNPFGNTPSNTEYQNLNMKANIAGGIFDQSLVLDIDKVNQRLLIAMPLSMGTLTGDIALEFQNLPGVSLETRTDAEGNMSLVLGIPLRYIVKNSPTFLPVSSRLPNGDPLPYLPGGELPYTALAIGNNSRVILYVGSDSVAFFVENKSTPAGFYLAFPIRTQKPVQQIGSFAMIPPKGTSMGGFFLGMKLPANIARLIESNLRF